jgi:hypothetical protein
VAAPARSTACSPCRALAAHDEASPRAALTRPFPFTRADGPRLLARRAAGDPGPDGADLPRLTGALPLADLGCGWHVVLVVTGEEPGDLWLAGEGFYPRMDRVDATRWPTFLGWYEDWLDQALAPGTLTSDPGETVEHPGEIRVLNFSKKGLTALPDQVFDCVHLGALLLDNNRLGALPDSLSDLPLLATLSLRATQLRALPAVMGKLPALAELSLHEMPDLDLAQALGVLATLPGLARLTVQTRDLPAEVGRLAGLRSLDCAGYFGDHPRPSLALPPSLASLPALTSLELSRHRLDEIPEVVFELPHLARLDLSGNLFTHLPSRLAELPSLRHLCLHENPLPEAEKRRIEALLPGVSIAVDEGPEE